MSQRRLARFFFFAAWYPPGRRERV